MAHNWQIARNIIGNFYSDSQDVRALLDDCLVPRAYWNDITAAIVCADGAVWFTENADWYDNYAIYRPVSYYTAH